MKQFLSTALLVALLIIPAKYSFALDTGPESLSLVNVRLGQSPSEVRQILTDGGFEFTEEMTEKVYRIEGVRTEGEKFLSFISGVRRSNGPEETINIWFTTNEGGNLSHLIQYGSAVQRDKLTGESDPLFKVDEVRQKILNKFGAPNQKFKVQRKTKEEHKWSFKGGQLIECQLKCPTPTHKPKPRGLIPLRGDYNAVRNDGSNFFKNLDEGWTAPVHASLEIGIREKAGVQFSRGFTVWINGEAVKADAIKKELAHFEGVTKDTVKNAPTESVPDL